MRLGTYTCKLKEGSRTKAIYQKEQVTERHRHRYELNNDYITELEKAGLVMSGINPDTELVEIIELTEHPWYIGVQFHPEYSSTVMEPHPLFVGFVEAAKTYKEKLKKAMLA